MAEYQRIDAFSCGAWEDSWGTLNCKEIKPVSPKGNPSWIFIERTDAKTPIFCEKYNNVRNSFTGKDPDAGKDWRPKEKRAAEDEMVR